MYGIHHIGWFVIKKQILVLLTESHNPNKTMITYYDEEMIKLDAKWKV